MTNICLCDKIVVIGVSMTTEEILKELKKQKLESKPKELIEERLTRIFNVTLKEAHKKLFIHQLLNNTPQKLQT